MLTKTNFLHALAVSVFAILTVTRSGAENLKNMKWIPRNRKLIVKDMKSPYSNTRINNEFFLIVELVDDEPFMNEKLSTALLMWRTNYFSITF